MICLACGAEQAPSGPGRCDACGAEFRTVSGLFGVNHISQLLQCLEDYRSGTAGVDEVQDRFGSFLDVWVEFSEAWGLQEVGVPEIFDLPPELDAVYGALLAEVDGAVELLNNALEGVEMLEEGGAEQLDKVEENVRLFSRRVCSAGAGIFTKLESRHGDFDSLLDAFKF